MRSNKIFEDLEFSNEFSVEDWNVLVKQLLGKYIANESILDKHRELLRTEVINFIRFSQKDEYLQLFDWICELLNNCIKKDKQRTIAIIAGSFQEIIDTDTRWMSNVLSQPLITELSERDKISFHFKIIDETLEGVFKPRFKLFDKISRLDLGLEVVNDSNSDFGRLIRDYPDIYKHKISLFLKDPYFLISTNQWRNIAAHKSYKIDKDSIIVHYGRPNVVSQTITIEEFYKIFDWSQDIYRVLRLAQVLIDLSFIKEIMSAFDGTEDLNVRFEASLFHIIHNLQIVGFEFVSTEDFGDTFILRVKGKIGFDVNASLIHASQCLDRLSCAIFDDRFVRDSFQNSQICIVDNDHNDKASAEISIAVALKKVKGEIDLDEYLDNMKFEIKTTPNIR